MAGTLTWPIPPPKMTRRPEAVLREKIEKVLDEIRLVLQADGGDVELLNVTEDGIVQVRLQGACDTCSGSIMTLKQGVERWVMEQVPEVRKVIAL
jgi:Fe-S cluster biogenesis protein NfuA